MPPDFQSWPRTPRLSKEVAYITEKIDGTNAQILITEDGQIQAGSRNRWITPEQDNYGFASWVRDNKADLITLGPGRYFGEWWGRGIQRGYDMSRQVFSLFSSPKGPLPSCVQVVPTLEIAHGDWSREIPYIMAALRSGGSKAAPGFMNPEGIVVYLQEAKTRYKVLLENDEKHKHEIAA